ncbi:DUF3310 domain-containing protein [Aeromonas enteropelogenes]|uniref:DUF3310 domain-containing protein n=1 Tax=Aeromonas enteropelogenes TaxID=29489 RepID=UPI001CC03FDE|nr:DUF3310 domain-containing protein [Aeromonas enteropelogenes]UAK70945.1 DUF3310 domain-containing protein [Aeromonas enteropelogenes]
MTHLKQYRNALWDLHQETLGNTSKYVNSLSECTVGRYYAIMVFGRWIPAKYINTGVFRIKPERRILLSAVRERRVSDTYTFSEKDCKAHRFIRKFNRVPPQITMTDNQETLLAEEAAAREAAIKRPKYYNLFADDSLESIDAIRILLTPEEFKGFLKGNILKYRFRAGGKDDILQDIGKAKEYNAMLADYVAKKEIF